MDLTWFNNTIQSFKLGLFFLIILVFPMIYRNRHLPHFLRRHGTDVSQVGPLNAALDDARSHLIGDVEFTLW